jgi:drug/metabolite transporter (DMT)-like permease
MRISAVAGIVLIVGGIALFLFGGSYTSRHDMMSVGGVTVSAHERHPIEPWIAGLAVLSGVGLVFAGMRGRREA